MYSRRKEKGRPLFATDPPPIDVPESSKSLGIDYALDLPIALCKGSCSCATRYPI